MVPAHARRWELGHQTRACRAREWLQNRCLLPSFAGVDSDAFCGHVLSCLGLDLWEDIRLVVTVGMADCVGEHGVTLVVGGGDIDGLVVLSVEHVDAWLGIGLRLSLTLAFGVERGGAETDGVEEGSVHTSHGVAQTKGLWLARGHGLQREDTRLVNLFKKKSPVGSSLDALEWHIKVVRDGKEILVWRL